MFKFLSVFLLLIGFSLSYSQSYAYDKPLNLAKNPKFKTREFSFPTPYGDLQVKIHAAENNLKKILRVEEIIRKDLSTVINYFEYTPKDPVHFNIDPYLLLSNGNATVFPQNVINLYTHPSVENEHLSVMDDWMRSLILHEYVHITHLSQTREYLDFGRKLFGTFPKLIPSITPRWFTEGIATWAESTFLPAGRLQNPILKREFLIKLNNPSFCQKIDCMDNPGVHPNAQMGYWFGAYFLDMIERQKPGAIRCMVVENSGKLPFSLNAVFENCTGSSLYAQFDTFKTMMKEEFSKISSAEKFFYLSNAFGANDPQRGMAIAGDRLLKVEDERQREALVSYDLKEGISNLNEFSYPIASIGDVITIHDETNPDELENWVVVAFFRDPNFRLENRQFSFVNVDTLQVEQDIDLGHQPLILKALSANHFISFSFEDDTFTIREKKQGEIEHYSVLPRNTTIVSADWNFDKSGLWLKGNDQGESFLGFLDIKNFKLSVLIKSKERLDTRIVDGKLLYKKANGEVFLLSYDSNKGEFFNEEINDQAKAFYFYDSAQVITNESYAVYYLKEIAFKPELSDERTKLLGSFRKKKISATEMLVNSSTESELPETKDYFTFNSLLPRWWFVSLASASNLSTFGLQTSFSDSFNRHSGTINLESYTSASKGTFYGGRFNYLFKQDQWFTELRGSRLVSENETSKSLIKENEVGLSTGLRWLLRRFTFFPALDISYQDESSAFSVAELKRGGIRFGINYQAMTLNDFLQRLSFQTRYGLRFPKVGDSYPDWGFLGSASVQFWPELVIQGKGSYARLEKPGLDRGILFGGGYTTSTTVRQFEFYGLNYGAVYGNEIVSMRMNIDYRAMEFYRGYKNWPFFARDLRLLVGRDWISADRIIVGRQVLRDKAVNSLWGGANLRWTFAYHIPVETKIIFAKVFNPDGADVRETLVTFDAEVW